MLPHLELEKHYRQFSKSIKKVRLPRAHNTLRKRISQLFQGLTRSNLIPGSLFPAIPRISQVRLFPKGLKPSKKLIHIPGDCSRCLEPPRTLEAFASTLQEPSGKAFSWCLLAAEKTGSYSIYNNWDSFSIPAHKELEFNITLHPFNIKLLIHLVLKNDWHVHKIKGGIHSSNTFNKHSSLSRSNSSNIIK